MKLELVTHVYDPPGLTQYSRMLQWQWRSLLTWGPASWFSEIDLAVCCTVTDTAVRSVLDEAFHDNTTQECCSVFAEFMPPEELFRRAIGRNRRALQTRADVVWFADVDYFVGEGFLDIVAAEVNADSDLSYPHTIMINTDHDAGDRMLEELSPGSYPADLFKPTKLRKAIGGVQFVGGNVARKYGYIPDTKWQKPVDPSRGFRQCRCDIPFRKAAAERESIRRFTASGLYRLRHNSDGRDYNLIGQHVGKKVWR